jgi:hypothetical protein
MKTLNTLLVSLFLLFTAAAYSHDDGTTIPTGYNECTCTCQNCADCRNKNPDELGEYDYRYRPISNRDFSDLKELISGRSFESTKIEIAKSGIERNYFKTEQVRELLQLFTFESNKLDLAKYAYSRTLDRNRYFKLYDVFTFESSISDIEDYINNQK